MYSHCEGTNLCVTDLPPGYPVDKFPDANFGQFVTVPLGSD
jgi:hypothetical protein